MAIIGGQINPANYPQPNYSGVIQSAQMQAQGLSNIGKSIGGALTNFGEAKKEQRKVDAYNKASAKSIEAAITLGKSYEIKGVEETLAPFLQSYNDPNLSPIEKAALLDEGKAMIPNVFGRFDKDQAMAIQKAQNAPPPPAPRTFKMEILNIGGKLLAVQRGSDGQIYSEDKQFPITNVQAYGEGKPPEVYSAGATSNADFIDGALNTPFPIADGSSGSLPPVGDVNPLFPALTPQDAAAIDAILAGGQLAPPVGEPPASIARPQPEPTYTPRYIAADEANSVEEVKALTNDQKKAYGLADNKQYVAKFANGKMTSIPEPIKSDDQIDTFRPATIEESAPFGGMQGQISERTGRFYPVQTSAPEQKLKLLTQAAKFYSEGKKAEALQYATAAGIGGLFGNLTISDLDDYFGSGAAPVDSTVPTAPTPETPAAPLTRKPLDKIITIPKSN
jgi:hypothetical protein